MSETINVPMAAQRDIKTVTTEIRTLHRQAQCMVLGYAIEIGRRLKEAKAMLDHGQWGPWLREEVDFSQSSANNFMRIFEEYGAQQVSLFGDANSQALGNLPYTHALRLLALPAEERESFVEEHHAEELSTRELEKLIRERDEARRAEQDAREKAAAADKARAAAEELAKGAEDARRDALAAALNTAFAPGELTLAGLHTGLNLLAKLKDPPPDAALRCAAEAEGVQLSLLSDYDLTGEAPSAAGTLVLGYGSLKDEACASVGETLKKVCMAAREASVTV